MSKNADSEDSDDRLKRLENRVLELSHEAKTSITAASGYAKLLARRKETLTEENRSDAVQQILTNLMATEEAISNLMKAAYETASD
jgi:K+-sensing histidine kinase KdpD